MQTRQTRWLLRTAFLSLGLAGCVHGPSGDPRRVTATDLGGRVLLHAYAGNGVWGECTTRQGDLSSYHDCGEVEVLQAAFLDVRCAPVESCTWITQNEAGSRYTVLEAHARAVEIDVRVQFEEEIHEQHLSLDLVPPEVAPRAWPDVPADFTEWERSDFSLLHDDQLLLGRSLLVCSGEIARADEVEGGGTRLVSRPAAALDGIELPSTRDPVQTLPPGCDLFTPDHAGVVIPRVLWLDSEAIAELAPMQVVEVLP